MHGQNVNGQNTAGGQNTSQNCKVGQNAVHFMGQGKQNSNLCLQSIVRPIQQFTDINKTLET